MLRINLDSKSQKAKIVATLRLLHRQWQPKKEARKRDNYKVQDGFFKNGNAKYKTVADCFECGIQCNVKETDMDHVDPVVSVQDGFVDWNTYISRLFATVDKYRTMCKPCHKAKSKIENAERRKNAKI